MHTEVSDLVQTADDRPTLATDERWSGGAGAVEGAIPAVAVHWMGALLHNGAGRYDDAFVAAEHARSALDGPRWTIHVLHELVEAAARTGRASQAARAHHDLHLAAGASGTRWARGIEVRARALVGDDEAAPGAFVEAIHLLSGTDDRVNEGRARLVYGEWLRRAQRRVDARHELRAAHEIFTELGIDGFSQRAGRELMATGETVRKRTDETRTELTPQEAEIARLAAEGRTNPEIGLELFISSRTVEWHLRKIFTKLGLTSRRELRHVLPDAEEAVA